MKRLIDGVTYNTDTTTLLARAGYEGDWNNESSPVEGELYQTRGGAFFIVEKIEYTALGPINEYGERHPSSAPVTKIRFIKCSEDTAKSWVTKGVSSGEVEVFLNSFEENVPKDETHGTVYVRMPASLKRQIEAAAESDGLSANSWAMRCFEKCLAEWSARTIHV
jgi:hypothetical protein